MVPGYYCLADMEPITCSLAVQQQSEQGTVLTKPRDSRELAQTAKGDHEAAAQINISRCQTPDITAGQEPDGDQLVLGAFARALASPLLAQV